MIYLEKSHMHEENIEYVEQYLRENRQFPIEQLIATLKEVGYHAEDIEAAQARLADEDAESAGAPVESLGSQDFVQPTTAPVAEQPALEPVSVETLKHTLSPEKKSEHPAILWWVLGGCSVLGLAAVAYFLLLPDPVAEPVIPDPKPSSVVTQSEPAPVVKPSLGDILAPHVGLVNQGDYRFSVKADRTQEGATPSMEEYIVYMKKGDVVRAEFSVAPNIAYILKNGKVFEVNTEKKEFREYDLTLAPGLLIADRVKNDFLALEAIFRRSASGDISWVEQPGSLYADSEIESEQTVRVRIDPVSRLISEISTRSSAGEAWRIISLTTSPVPNIDELMRFPLEYKKMTL